MRGDAGVGGAGLVRVQLLGAVRAWRDEHELTLGTPRQRAVLAMLALRAGQPVTRDQLIDGLWGDQPPGSAVNVVHTYMAGLRRGLQPEHNGRGCAGVLSSAGHGLYVLRLDRGRLDLGRFDECVGRARQLRAGGDPAAAAESFDAALAMWQGMPLAGIPGPFAEAERARLTEQYLTVAEDHSEAMLAAGHHAQIVGDLTRLIEENPFRERLAGLLILALARNGRQCEALAAYQRTRRLLVEELGIEPSSDLRRLQDDILHNRDVGLGGKSGAAGVRLAAAARVVPRQLPPAVRQFTGRQAELNALSGLVGDVEQPAGAVVISAIGGTAGMGKTALAIHWAHQVAGRFPDGQLYANLCGFDPRRPPMSAADGLDHFLRALGVAPTSMPASLDERAGLYRSLLAGKRALVLLDNARDEEQVRPLLPGSPGCMAVVTSRRQLTGLAVAEDARLLSLDVVSDAEARELLASRLGERRVADEQGAVTELISLCAGLPLALAVAAARAAAHPSFRLAAVAAELHDEHTRLEVLDAGDPSTSMQAVFSWSYRHLTPTAARLFRLLGLQPGPDITPLAAASLAHHSPDQAYDLLRVLARESLLGEPVPGRFAFHDLLRAYAARQCRTQDSEDERRAALTRLFDYYLAAASSAMDNLAPAERHRRPAIPPQAASLPSLDAPAAARAWLDAERANLVAVARHTATDGWPTHTIRLAATLYRYYLDIGGHLSDALATHTHALHAARESGNRAAQADALLSRAVVDQRQGRYGQAVSQLRQSLAVHRDLGDREGQARTLGNLGACLWCQARYEAAAGHFRQALDLHRELGDRFGQAINLDNLGTVLCRQGRYQQAAHHHRQALALCRELGDRNGEACALDNLGAVLCRQGHYQEAAVRHKRALAMFRELGDRNGEAEALNNLGAARLGQGRPEHAAGHHWQALALSRELGDQRGEADALNGNGEALNALGQAGQARAQHHDALNLASQVGDPYLEARSHNGLAGAYHTAGNLDRARHHWELALALYTSLGVPEAQQVGAKLSSLSTAAPSSRPLPASLSAST